jgi:hypothetical protein
LYFIFQVFFAVQTAGFVTFVKSNAKALSTDCVHQKYNLTSQVLRPAGSSCCLRQEVPSAHFIVAATPPSFP